MTSRMLTAEFGPLVSRIRMKVSNLCIYQSKITIDPDRLTRISSWLKKKGGRKITDSVFSFADGREPTFEEFELACHPCILAKA